MLLFKKSQKSFYTIFSNKKNIGITIYLLFSFLNVLAKSFQGSGWDPYCVKSYFILGLLTDSKYRCTFKNIEHNDTYICMDKDGGYLRCGHAAEMGPTLVLHQCNLYINTVKCIVRYSDFYFFPKILGFPTFPECLRTLVFRK